MMDELEFDERMQRDGWCAFENLVPDILVGRMRQDCLAWIEICRKYQIERHINANGDGTAHHTLGAGDGIDAFVHRHLLHRYISRFLNGVPYIMHACNPVGGFPGSNTYVHQVHRDVGTYIPGYNIRINMLVMLDDFTIENGATRVLRSGHRLQEKPSDEAFERDSEPILGTAGTVVLFNSYLWHRGGYNATEMNRVALTLSFGPAFVKPQMDYARYLGEEYGRTLSDLSRQVLGYNARVATNLDEWYKRAPERLYQANQG